MPAYAELTPAELQSEWDAGAVALIPWGALEWHGPHLPLGLDLILAEEFCNRLSESMRAVTLPPMSLPITCLPHKDSLDFDPDGVREALERLLGGLLRSGAKAVAVVTGHYAQGHLVELNRAALNLAEEGLPCAVGTPLSVLGEDDLLDHAGRWEAAQLLAVQPDLVHLEKLEGADLQPARHSVLGGDPRPATAEEGREIWARALNAWRDLLQSFDADSAVDRAEAEIASQQDYLNTWKSGRSYDEAIRRWWSDRISK